MAIPRIYTKQLVLEGFEIDKNDMDELQERFQAMEDAEAESNNDNRTESTGTKRTSEEASLKEYSWCPLHEQQHGMHELQDYPAAYQRRKAAVQRT